MFSQKLKIFGYYHAPVLLWMGLIFYFSSLPDLKVGMLALSWEIIVRKLAHIGEYLVLSGLVFRCFYLGMARAEKKALVWSLAIVLFFAISDELHQTMVVGRTGKGIDVVVDMLGALMGSSLADIFYLKRMKRFLLFIIFVAAVSLGLVVYSMILESRRLEEAKQVPLEATEIGRVEIEDDTSIKEDPKPTAEIESPKPTPTDNGSAQKKRVA